MLYAKFMYPESGLHADIETAKMASLEVGKKYVVEDVCMGGWFTDIYLKGFDEAFNSVQFEFEEGGESIDIYSDPRYNPYMYM